MKKIKISFSEECELIYGFVEDCYILVKENQKLTKKMIRILNNNYKKSFEDKYLEYFENEMLSDDLFYMYDFISANINQKL